MFIRERVSGRVQILIQVDRVLDIHIYLRTCAHINNQVRRRIRIFPSIRSQIIIQPGEELRFRIEEEINA